MREDVILDVNGLSVRYKSSGVQVGPLSFSICRGRVLGLLGESGSGKSTVCGAALGLLDTGAAQAGGSIRLLGREILPLTWEGRGRVNGKEIGVVLQNPMTAFDPCLRIRGHFIETLRTHLMCGRRDAVLYGLSVLERVGLADGKRIMASYPHQLSGGMLQRVMVALAIALNPVLIIADEPTTALDAASQTLILNLLARVKRELRPAMLVVSHDMDVMDALADEVAVMKEGQIVERGPPGVLKTNPAHPYTKELVEAARMMEVAWCSP